MRFVKHTVNHFLVHLALFAGFALLIPVMTSAIEDEIAPWLFTPELFFGGIMLILISAFILYRIKGKTSSFLQSLGTTIFLPGLLSLLMKVLDFEHFFESYSDITGMSFVKPVAESYIEHSVPTVLAVAAVYLCIGGVLYWAGHKIERVQSKLNWD